MRITLSIYNPQGAEQDSLLTLEVFPDMTLSTLRESIQAESQVAPAAQNIYHNGRIVRENEKTIEQLEIKDGDMLAVHVRDTTNPVQQRRAAPASRTQQPQQRQRGQNDPDPELIRLQILGNPSIRGQIAQQHPELAAAVDDPARFASIFFDARDRDQRERMERQREIERLNDDPFNIENQRRIEEMIREEQVMENLQSAMEHNPEVFGRVHLLYINVEVNGYKIKALVDSGAQATIMSPAAAEACGIMRLIDKRFAGIARGVGTANILGRVHAAQIKIGDLHLPSSFTVMEGKSVDLLFGLDMLKRYQATIDLSKNMLCIQGYEIPFLGESEIPKEEEEAARSEPTVPGPGGTSIGQETGAVHTRGEGLEESSSSAPRQTGSSQPAVPSGSTAGSGSGPASGNEPQPPAPNVTPAHVDSLVAMGAARDQAIQALQVAEDNVEVAAGLIFF